MLCQKESIVLSDITELTWSAQASRLINVYKILGFKNIAINSCSNLFITAESKIKHVFILNVVNIK